MYLDEFPTEVVYEGSLFSIREHRVGLNKIYQSVIGRDSVAIITVNMQQRFGVSVQSQIGKPKMQVLAGGYIEDNQTPTEACIAELQQEFGCKSTNFRKLGVFQPTKKVIQKQYLYLATEVYEDGEQDLDEDEQVHSIDWIDFGEFLKWSILQDNQRPVTIFVKDMILDYLLSGNKRINKLIHFLELSVGSANVEACMATVNWPELRHSI
ncbi:MAG: NUDIX hydrolase [Patescibacteria group bacterium]